MPDGVREIDFTIPVKGTDEFTSYSTQPLDTSPLNLNVRTFDIGTNRARVGQRPGLQKAYDEDTGTPAINVLNGVSTMRSADLWTGADSDPFTAEAAGDSLGVGWSVPDDALSLYINGANHNITATEGGIGDPPYMNFRKPLVLSPLTTYCVSIKFTAEADATSGNIIRLYLRMNDDAPDPAQDGICVTVLIMGASAGTLVSPVTLEGFTFTKGANYTYDGYISQRIGGKVTKCVRFTTVANEASPTQQILKVFVLRNDIYVQVGPAATPATILAVNVFEPQDGFRTGLELQNTVGLATLDDWSVTGVLKVGAEAARRTVIFVNNQSDKGTAGTLAAVSGDQVTSPVTTGSKGVMSAEAYGKLFIADFNSDATRAYLDAAVTQGTAATISSSSGVLQNEVNDTGIGTGVDNALHLVELSTEHDDQAYLEVHKITTVAANKLTITHGFPWKGNTRYRTDVGPKVYDPAANTLAFWMAERRGSVPLGCRIIWRYRGRVGLAGSAYDRGNFFMSRQGDPCDWRYAMPDAQTAVAAHLTEEGRLPGTITAVAPWTDDYFIMSTKYDLFIQRGDPAAGGHRDILKQGNAILDRFAWCHDDSGALYFMSATGLYRMVGGNQPEPVSLNKLPRSLSNISTISYEVLLAYDLLDVGVHICVTRRATGTSTHWFYDIRADAFWRQSYPDAQGPTMLCDFRDQLSTRGALLWGGRDGYVRKINRAATATDDGTAIDSYCWFAPQRLAGKLRVGVLNSLQAVLGGNSDGVDWGLYSADSHEQALAASAVASGTWSVAGMNPREALRVRAGSLVLKLSNSTSGKTWAVEQVTGTARIGGIERI